MRMSRLLCCALLLGALPVRADGLEFFAQNNPHEFSLFAGIWDYGVGGDIATGGNRITIDSDNGIKANPQAQVLLHYGFENRWIPALTAAYMHVGGAGQYLAPASLQFGGITILSGNTLILAGVNFNDYELDADWRLLAWREHQADARTRSILEVQPGIALKYLAGHANVVGTTTIGVIGIPLGTVVQQQRFALDQPVPLLHGRVEFNPWPVVHLELSGGYFALNGSHAGEMRAVGTLELYRGLSITLGYQEQLYKVKDDPYLLHARLNGPTAGLSYVGF
jgi:hypothetical protein